MNSGKLTAGIFQKSIPVVLAGMLLVSCNDDDPTDNKVDFDRKAMLENWAGNIIIPAYADFDDQLSDFRESVDSLRLYNNQASLVEARERFRELYRTFQQVKPFEVGPAADISFKAAVNTYPTDTTQILNNIQQGNYDLSTAANVDAKGLPALDFLLFGRGQQLLQDEDLQQYLGDCTDDVEILTTHILDTWDAYRSSFVNATGTDIGSSLGQMINAVNKDYELIKNAKIGFPAGKRTLGQAYPHTCEAYFGGFSLELAEENTISIQNFFNGVHYNGAHKGPSLQQYLQELEINNNNQPLDEAINEQFNSAIVAIQNVPEPLSDAVVNHKNEVDTAYLEVQKNVVLLKVDMPSALGVLITYQDNDGD